MSMSARRRDESRRSRLRVCATGTSPSHLEGTRRSMETPSRLRFGLSRFSKELPQESQVAALEQADIIDGVAHHGQARESQAEGEATPLVRIDTAHAQDFGMHQATGHELHPAALLADGAAGTAANEALDVE